MGQDEKEPHLARALRLSWRKKVTRGFFLRAETFRNFAKYIEEVGNPRLGNLRNQSHGESFFSAFDAYLRYREGIYLLDEPESALSPTGQLSFLRMVYQLARPGRGQFIIATHSPILLAFPGARILSFGADGALVETPYEKTEHYRIAREFLSCPERYLKHLFEEGEDARPF